MPTKHLFAAAIVGLAAASFSYADRAQAVTYGVTGFEGLASELAIGEAQFFIDVTDATGGLVDFTFRNVGPAASSITRVYFEDSIPLFSNVRSVFAQSDDVNFVFDVNPANIPGGVDISFAADFNAGSTAPVEPNGVHPDQFVTIRLGLLEQFSYASVLGAIGDSDLRIGVRAQGLPGSAGFVNNPAPIPLPAAAWMLLSALGGLGLLGFRRKQTA